MSPRTKKILIVVAVFLGLATVGCIVCAVSGATSFNSWAGQMRQQGEATQREAREWANGKDQNACLDEARRRDEACGPQTEISCHALASAWLGMCLDAAAPVAGICDGVPPTTEMMQSANWAVAQCQGQPDQGGPCRNRMQSLQRYCDGQRGH